MAKGVPKGAKNASSGRVRAPRAPSARGIDTIVTNTKLVGSNILKTMCPRSGWTLTTVMRSNRAHTQRKQQRRHEQRVAEHAAEDHAQAPLKPNSTATLCPVSCDGCLHDRCHRCHRLTRTSCIEVTEKMRHRQQKRHAEKVVGHVCRDGVSAPSERELPVIGQLEVDVLNLHSKEAKSRLAKLSPSDRVKDTEGAIVYAYTPGSAALLLRMLDLRSGSRLLYVGCGWGEIFLAWALAWGASCAFEEAAGKVLLDVHAIDLVPSAIGIFLEALLGLASSGAMRATVDIHENTVIIGGSLRLVVRSTLGSANPYRHHGSPTQTTARTCARGRAPPLLPQSSRRPVVLPVTRQVQCANVMELATLWPYTHTFSSVTCPHVTGNIFELAAKSPVRVTTFSSYVDTATKKFNGTRSDAFDARGDRLQLTLAISGGKKTMSSFIFTGGCLP